jgi:Zn-dependent membrane protease YugP
VVLFHLVTLPVELNASKRAITQMVDLGIISGVEVKGARKVLSAAAMTYVAALATAVANLIRILLIRGRE